MKYIKYYLKQCVPPLLVVYAGFILSGKSVNLLVLLTVAIHFLAIDCYNSYFDKKNSIKRFFLFDNKVVYSCLYFFLEIVVLFITIKYLVVLKSQYILLVLLPTSHLCFYINLRKKLYLPNHIIALQWAILALFGVDFWNIETIWPFIFSLSVFFIISARSILEDTEHKLDYSRKYKQTLFSKGIPEEEIIKRSARLIFFGLLFGSTLFYFLGFNINASLFFIGFVPIFFLSLAMFYFSDRSVPFQKNALDWCAVLMLISILSYRYI